MRSKPLYASEYQQAINRGEVEFSLDEQGVFTLAALKGLECADHSLNQLETDWDTLKQAEGEQWKQGQAAADKDADGLGEHSGVPYSASQAASVRAPESPGSSSPAAAADDVIDPELEAQADATQLSHELLDTLSLTQETAWLLYADKEALIFLLEYRRNRQKRQHAEEAAQHLTPGMVKAALLKMLWHTSNCPERYVLLLAAAYPFGPDWLVKNSSSLWQNHVQGNYGTQGCIAQRHIAGLAAEEQRDERDMTPLHRYLGQPLPPGPPGLPLDEWADRYLASQRQ